MPWDLWPPYQQHAENLRHRHKSAQPIKFDVNLFLPQYKFHNRIEMHPLMVGIIFDFQRRRDFIEDQGQACHNFESHQQTIGHK
jgi:hypothetical protein